jgi:hypothetical protein
MTALPRTRAQAEPARRRNLWLIQDTHDPFDVADLSVLAQAALSF